MSPKTLPLEEQLKAQFGLKSFRDGQRAVIERLLQGKSAAAIFPTGGGKSLCYQFPATQLEGLTLVVSPLLALMREQVDSLNELGIEARRLDSTLGPEEVGQVLQQIREGTTRILYVAPERFFNERFREFIKSVPIALFAIDEAHCISQWGHNFRPDYLKLSKLARELGVGRILALTATATPPVLDDICEKFSIEKADAIQTAFFRSNLQLRFTPCDSKSRDKTLLECLQTAPRQSTLVYVTLQRTAERVAELLADEGLNARAYHAGLPAEERAEIQDWFMKSPDAIVVATIAFGMGVDKSNIRAVYHYNASKSLENYAQEIGRAGRDGETALCETLLVPEDRVTLDNFAYGDTPTRQSIREFVEFLVGQPQEFFMSYFALAYETDIRESVIRTLLTHLELKECLEATASRYDTYQYKARTSSTEILKHFEGERRRFASSVLALSVKKKIWFQINLAQAANRLNCERGRIVRMLEYFSEKGWIELKASGLMHGYRKLQSLGDIESLTDELYDFVMERQVSEIGRVDEFLELVTAETCQAAFLSKHFGQVLDVACGCCSFCRGEGSSQLPTPRVPRVGDSAVSGVRKLKSQRPEILGDVLQQARFLCGLSSPRLARARLQREALYGCCAAVPFEQVLDALVGS